MLACLSSCLQYCPPCVSSSYVFCLHSLSLKPPPDRNINQVIGNSLVPQAHLGGDDPEMKRKSSHDYKEKNRRKAMLIRVQRSKSSHYCVIWNLNIDQVLLRNPSENPCTAQAVGNFVKHIHNSQLLIHSTMSCSGRTASHGSSSLPRWSQSYLYAVNVTWQIQIQSCDQGRSRQKCSPSRSFLPVASNCKNNGYSYKEPCRPSLPEKMGKNTLAT